MNKWWWTYQAFGLVLGSLISIMGGAISFEAVNTNKQYITATVKRHYQPFLSRLLKKANNTSQSCNSKKPTDKIKLKSNRINQVSRAAQASRHPTSYQEQKMPSEAAPIYWNENDNFKQSFKYAIKKYRKVPVKQYITNWIQSHHNRNLVLWLNIYRPLAIGLLSRPRPIAINSQHIHSDFSTCKRSHSIKQFKFNINIAHYEFPCGWG